MHRVAFELTGTKESSEEEGEMVPLLVLFGHELYTEATMSHGDVPWVFVDQPGHDILARFAVSKVERAYEEAVQKMLQSQKRNRDGRSEAMTCKPTASGSEWNQERKQ